ncbi:hypothetical protein [Streptomyces sp. NBC_01294]|uniref:hypothetical protein n=1 Tax=Streptomyces sp. NBC_01294 TaxID=2903815 RepID=UPI002DDC6AD8|nr:hypothetical protein [Streptomyces sp. NBC_01294]WRZ62367.1 hypothetical protein OG534_38400 [Streptomyces sp. NBC_01294]
MALGRPAPPAYRSTPAGPGPAARGSERAKADQERSLRLLKAIDEAADDGTGLPGKLPEFEWSVLHGVAGAPGREYPPPGHGYQRA